MNSLYARVALLLGAALVVFGTVLLTVTHPPPDAASWLATLGNLLIGAIVFALLAALGVSQLLTQRLTRLADAVDTFERGGFATPLRVPGADAQGDAAARLEAHVEAMSGRIAGQIAALEAAARQRRNLLANVSHDLRTPLASMHGYLELLARRLPLLEPAQQRDYLQAALRNGERLQRLVGGLLQLTDLEAHERPPQSEDFSLAEVVQDVAQKFAFEAGRRGVQLRFGDEGREGREAGAPQRAPLRVCADLGLVERVISNLLDNAIRHTPEGGRVRIEIGSDGARAQVAVRDNGEGIAAADLPGLFERYYDAERVADSATSLQGGLAIGLGLGLAIARRIVQLHGGELRVCSQAGEGTSVVFDLPLA